MTDINLENPNEMKKSLLYTSAKLVFFVAVIVTINLFSWSCTDSSSRTVDNNSFMLRERDSLLNEIRNIQDHYVNLQNEKETLTQSLERENQTNKVLKSNISLNNKQIKTSNSKIAEQSDRIKYLSAKNDSLLATIDVMLGKMDEIDKKIAMKEKETLELKDNISVLNNAVKEKDEKISDVNEGMIILQKTDSVKMVPRFITAAELTGGWGMNTTDIPYAHWLSGATVVAGLEFNRRFLAGFGAGAHIFNGGTLIPIFVEFRYGFPTKNFTPYLFSKGGALLNFESNNSSNIFLNAGIGLRHQFSDKLGFNFGTGLYTHNSGQYGRSSFLTMNLGLIFTNNGTGVK